MCQFIHIRNDPKYFSDIILTVSSATEGEIPQNAWRVLSTKNAIVHQVVRIAVSSRQHKDVFQFAAMSRKPGVSVCVCAHAHYVRMYTDVCVHECICWGQYLGCVNRILTPYIVSTWKKLRVPGYIQLQLYDIMKYLILYFKKTHILKDGIIFKRHL